MKFNVTEHGRPYFQSPLIGERQMEIIRSTTKLSERLNALSGDAALSMRRSAIMRSSLMILLCLMWTTAFSQHTFRNEGKMVVNGSAAIVLKNTRFINDGTFSADSGTVYVLGNGTNSQSAIGGDSVSVFYDLRIGKSSNGARLEQNIWVNHELQMNSGILDLNGFDLSLGSSSGTIIGESETSRITGPSGGEVIKSVELNAPAGIDPGNMGAVISSSADLGMTTIRRGHVVQVEGTDSSIARYFDIVPSNNTGLDATLRFRYFDQELGTENESVLTVYRFNGSGWEEYLVASRDETSNYVEAQNIDAFSRWTLFTDLCADQQFITLTAGWNMVSAYALPDDPNLTDVLASVASEVIIVKDELGRVYFPSIELNQIGDWLISEGYKIKSSSDTSFAMGCSPVDPETTPIPLSGGWNIASYLRTGPMSPDQAWASLGDTLIIGKDNLGNVFLPELGLNTIGDLQPGQGYQMKLSSPVDLLYPGNTARYSSPVIDYYQPPAPRRLQYSGNTGNNATIIFPEGTIDGLQSGDEIGVYNSRDLLCGSAVYEEGRHLALAVWGNELAEGDDDHLAVGELYRFRVWRSSEQEFFELSNLAITSGTPEYEVNGLTIIGQARVVDDSKEEIPLFHTVIWPNPASDIIHIEATAFHATEARLEVFSMSGAKLHAQFLPVTDGLVRWEVDVRSWPMGEYIWRIKSEEEYAVGKFAVSGIRK